jgi:hypothetical protein
MPTKKHQTAQRGQYVAEHVIRKGEVLNDVAGADEDRRRAPDLGIEALGGERRRWLPEAKRRS